MPPSGSVHNDEARDDPGLAARVSKPGQSHSTWRTVGSPGRDENCCYVKVPQCWPISRHKPEQLDARFRVGSVIISSYIDTIYAHQKCCRDRTPAPLNDSAGEGAAGVARGHRSLWQERLRGRRGTSESEAARDGA